MKLVDDNKRIAADHLKTADKLIKAGEFDRATEEISKARVADPKNLYILAYEERIQYAREEAQKKSEQEVQKPVPVPVNAPVAVEPPAPAPAKPDPAYPDGTQPSPPPVRKTEDEIRGNGQLDADAVQSPEKPLAIGEIVIKVGDIDSVLELIKTNADRFSRRAVEDAREKAQAEYRDKIDNEIRTFEIESQKKQAEQIQIAVATFQKRLETEAQVKLESEISAMTKKVEQDLEERLLHLEDERELRYAEMSKELFTMAIEQLLVQGLTDEEYTKIITGIAHGLTISPEQTLQMKKKTQERYYLDAVEIAWSDGTVSLEESERLALLRDRFGITPEEHFHLESLVRRKMLEVKK